MKSRLTGMAATVLLGALVAPTAFADPIGYSAWDIYSGNDRLVRVNLATGVAQTIGTNIGFSDIDGLAFSASGQLYGVDDSTNKLVAIDTTTGAGMAIGSGFGSGFNDMGLAFVGNSLYMASTNGSGVGQLYAVDTGTGGATLIGSFGDGLKVRSLGAHGNALYGWSNIDTLVTINTTTAAYTTVGPFGFPNLTEGQDGMDIDPASGTVWAISEFENRTYTLSKTTGAATVFATSLTCDGAPCYDSGRFNGLAIAPVPEPGSYAMMLAGLGLLGLIARRRGRLGAWREVH